MNQEKSILNLAGGKILPFQFPNSDLNLYSELGRFLVNLDYIYYDSHPVSEILKSHLWWKNQRKMLTKNLKLRHDDKLERQYNMQTELNCNINIYKFLERYHILFDVITMYRFLEHVPKTKVLYFIYLLSTCLEIGGYLDVIVPDYKKLATRIITENPFSNVFNFEEEDIITTFELLNEPNSPHMSIWTKDRIHYFFELEKRFKIENIIENYEFDGRDIYIRFLSRRVK